MDIAPEELSFVRDLVKAARQRVHHITWTDRDGTKRLTVLTEPEFTRLKKLSAGLRLSPAEALRQAAHIPNSK